MAKSSFGTIMKNKLLWIVVALALVSFVAARASRRELFLALTPTPSPSCPSWARAQSGDFPAARSAKLVERAKTGKFTVSLFGDSITNFLEPPAFGIKYLSSKIGVPVDKIGNFGLFGSTTQTLMYRVCNGGVSTNNQVVVLLIGTNNLRLEDTPQQIVDQIWEILKVIMKANPKARVVVSSIFNRADFQEKRKAVNELLRKKIEWRKNPNIFFTTAGEVLTMNNTRIDSKTGKKDNLHPDNAGYKQIFDAGFADAIKKAIAKKP
jgi:lysophospholipase L1-like esterase